MAHHNKASTLVITDSQMSPSTRFATALLTVKEGNAFGFRSLTNTMCLCQALFIALAYKLELNIEQLEEGFRRSAVIARPAFSPIDFRSRKLLVSR
jgi:DNA-binding MurR/RpiR family transcriptional regulator